MINRILSILGTGLLTVKAIIVLSQLQACYQISLSGFHLGGRGHPLDLKCPFVILKNFPRLPPMTMLHFALRGHTVYTAPKHSKTFIAPPYTNF